MNKNEYITRVEKHLQILNREERDDAIQYLEEYFDEAGVDNAQQVIDELGAPAKYAAQIKAEAAIRNTSSEFNHRQSYETRNSSLKTALMIVGGIFALPIALPLMFALVILLFAFAIVIFSLLFAAVVTAIACIITAVPLLFTSFGMFTLSFGDGLVSLGSSLGLIGVSILIILLFYLFFSTFIPWFIKAMGHLFQKLKGGKKNEDKE